MSDLKATIDEFASIAASLPENLQLVCFELLLDNHLNGAKHEAKILNSKASDPSEKSQDVPDNVTTPAASQGQAQLDISLPNLHLKVKKFPD